MQAGLKLQELATLLSCPLQVSTITIAIYCVLRSQLANHRCVTSRGRHPYMIMSIITFTFISPPHFSPSPHVPLYLTPPFTSPLYLTTLPHPFTSAPHLTPSAHPFTSAPHLTPSPLHPHRLTSPPHLTPSPLHPHLHHPIHSHPLTRSPHPCISPPQPSTHSPALHASIQLNV